MVMRSGRRSLTNIGQRAYFVDAEGRIRHHHFGEHDYENSERVIQELLEEAGYRNVPGGFVTASSAVPLTAFAVRKEGDRPRSSR